MLKPYIYFIATCWIAIFATSSQAGIVFTSRCLHGKVNNAACLRMLRNYEQVAPIIERVALREGVDPALIKALVGVESGYDFQAKSPKGARGLTQVMPTTGMGLGVQPDWLWHSETNLATGTRFLANQWRYFHDWHLAIAAYNAGPAAVRDFRDGTNISGKNPNRLIIPSGIPPYPETQAYVANVLWLYGRFKRYEI